MGKKPKGRRDNPQSSPSTSINEEDKRILNIAKQAMKENELNINEFIQLLEDDYASSYEEKKKGIDAQLEIEKEERSKKIEEDFRNENADLITENNSLKASVEETKRNLNDLEKKVFRVRGNYTFKK